MTSGQAAGQGLPHRRLWGKDTTVSDDETKISGCSGCSITGGALCSGRGDRPDELQLKKLLVGLEDGLLCEELSQNTPVMTKNEPK